MRSCDLYHVIDGRGSPNAAHGKEAVCPLGMVWFLGDSTNVGGTRKKVVKKMSRHDNTYSHVLKRGKKHYWWSVRTKWMDANQDKVEVLKKKKPKWHSSFVASTSEKVWRLTVLRICILTLFYYLVKQRKYVTTQQLYLELSNRNRPELIPVSCLQCTSKILDYRGLEKLC